MRLPYAAKQLIKQVQAEWEDVTVTASNPDGLGVTRTITFDTATSALLEPLLTAIKDPRIESMSDDEGHLTINFVPTAKADDRSAFPLIAAKVVNDYKAPPRPMYPPGEFEGDELVEDSLNDSGDGDPGVEGSGVETTSNP